MKSRLYLYLFIFSILLAIFIYMNSKSILDSYEVDINKFKEREVVYKDSINNLIDKNLDLLYFNLENNDDALTYFENDGLDANGISEFIKDKLYESNDVKGTHPIIPFESVDSKMLINTVRILNHKWIIADFSDGTFWGELLIKYEINKTREITFELLETFIYPTQSY